MICINREGFIQDFTKNSDPCNPPFLILKVRHPAVTGVYCIVRVVGVVVVMISNALKHESLGGLGARPPQKHFRFLHSQIYGLKILLTK